VLARGGQGGVKHGRNRHQHHVLGGFYPCNQTDRLQRGIGVGLLS
jgi:hypothetical protein